jgi:tRNA threonylcarbamoyl adenosine modification protein YeaZ
MLLLALDTAGPDCAAALARSAPRGCEIVARRSECLGRGHAERLMPMIAELLAETATSFTHIRRIVVTTGPGSFTGIRVGVAAARGLALALAVPAVGVGSLEALAFNAAKGRETGTAVAALDAKRGEIYVLAQDIASGAALLEAAAVSLDAVAARLAGAREPVILTGSAAPLLARLLSSNAEIAGTAASPDIADVAMLGLRKIPGHPPVPTYARGADAKPQGDKAVARL